MRSPAENSSVSSTQAFFLPCPGGGANAKLAEKIHGLQWTDDQGQMVVNWPLHYQPGQRVLLTFENVEYTRLNNETSDPTQILYHGQAPDVIETNQCGNDFHPCYNLSYIVAVSGTSFTLDETAFTWPTSTLVYDTNITASDQGCWTQTNSMSGATHHLGFSGFHNLRLVTCKNRPKGKTVFGNTDQPCKVCDGNNGSLIITNDDQVCELMQDPAVRQIYNTSASADDSNLGGFISCWNGIPKPCLVESTFANSDSSVKACAILHEQIHINNGARCPTSCGIGRGEYKDPSQAGKNGDECLAYIAEYHCLCDLPAGTHGVDQFLHIATWKAFACDDVSPCGGE